jgi:tight adherence protein C
MTLFIAVLSGVAIAAGAGLVVAALRPGPPRLADALAMLNAGEEPPPVRPTGRRDRIGAWAGRTLRITPSAAMARRLTLQHLTVYDLAFRKVAWALVGLLAPLTVALLAFVLTGAAWTLAVPVALICASFGFFVPDLLLRSLSEDATADANESLLTFFDLVILERLANQSASQSLANAASVSGAPMFRRIATALDTARLEQRPPFQQLRTLGRDLALAPLVDLADVMRLDDAGASLAGALRARVKELRDAHLNDAKVAASAVSERMTLFMVVPSMVFGLIFLVPPLLRLIAG